MRAAVGGRDEGAPTALTKAMASVRHSAVVAGEAGRDESRRMNDKALPPSLPPPVPPHPSKPAGFGMRLLAHLIDSAIWTFLMTLVVFGLFGREMMEAVRKAVEQASDGAVVVSSQLFQPPLWFTLVFNYALPIAMLVLLWKWKSATPGKMMLKLKVVDAATKGRLTMRQCVLRMLGYIPPMIPLMFFISAPIAPQPMLFIGAGVFTCPLLWTFISIASDPQKRGWHDKLAGTMLVEVR